MRPIDKFILHVVHNWTNELNETYSEKAIKGFIKHFQDQADELNTAIPDESTLRRYINTFDRIKNSSNIKEKDLFQYTLPTLIKLVTSVEDKEAPKDDIDITPDVVYHNDDDSIAIYNGSTEGNCIKYGKGERWCITKTSFPTYRGSDYRSFPTFYLARNTNLDNENYKLSFVAIQVRNPETTTEENRYVYTNRDNSPNESKPMNFERLVSEVPWLNDIPNIRSILKYIGLSKAEKVIQKYGGSPIPVEDWINLEFDIKIGYLVQRKNKSLFSDIDENEFVREYLPEYPKIAMYIATNYGIISPIDLLRNLDKFSNQDRRSITANLQEKIDINHLNKRVLPFNVKQLLTQLDKWNLPIDKQLYNTKYINDPAIAELILNKYGEIDINLYLETKKYENIKSKAKYIANYPQINKLPFKNLIWAAQNNIISNNKLNTTLETAKDDPSSPLIIKNKENGKLVLDANTYTVYDLEGESTVKVPPDDEVTQELLNTAKTTPAFQDNTINIIKQCIDDREDIPFDINDNREAFTSTIENTPYSRRIIQGQGDPYILLKPENEPDDSIYALFVKKANNKTVMDADFTFGNFSNWRRIDTRNSLSQSMWAAFFKYLRATNQFYTNDELINAMNSSNISSKEAFIRANPPLDPNGRFAVAYYQNTYYIIDKISPANSKKLSSVRNTLNKATVPQELLRQVLGQQPTTSTRPTPAQMGAGERVPAPLQRATQAAAAPAALAPQAGNDTNRLIAAAGLTAGFNTLPTTVKQRIQAGTAANPRTERTARSRDMELGNRGNVTGVIVSGQSKMVIIQMASGVNIAQISIQPEARHYIVTSTTSFDMGRVSNFINALAQRNISEAIRGYVKQNPHHLNKVYEILKYINETKKQ